MELKKKKGFRVATYALVILAIFLVVFFTSCGKKDKGSTAPASQAAPAASAPASAPASAAPAPAPAPAAPAPAPAPAPAKEAEAPAKAETPAPEPAPVEEVKLPVAEDFGEEFDTFSFTKTVSVGDGYGFKFDVATGKAVISYPKAVSDDYAASLLKAAAEAYAPQYGDYFKYITVEKLGGGELVVTYPETVDEATLSAAVDLIIEELTKFVASESNVAADDIYYFSTSIDVGNDYVDAEVYRGSLTATAPKYITYEDALAVAQLILKDNPGVFDDVKVELLSENSARFYYPKNLSEEDVLAGIDLVQKEIALYLSNPAVVSTKAAEAKKTASVSVSIQVVAKQTVTETTSRNLFSRTESLYGYDLVFDAAKGKAKVTYPAFITDKEIVDFFTAKAPKYAAYTNGITVGKISDGVLAVTYPEEYTAEDLNAAIDVLIVELNAYVADMIKAAEEAAAAAAAEAAAEAAAPAPAPAKLEFAFTRTIDVKEVGLSGTIEADKGSALITYPAVIYQSDINAYVGAVLAEFPAAYDLVTYEQVGEGQVKVYYSEDFTAEDVNYAIDYLEAKLYAMLGLEMPVKEEPVAEAPAAEAAAPAPAPAKLEFAFTRTIDVKEVGLSGTIEADKGSALITYPAVIYQSDINAYVGAVLAEFPAAYDLVTYEQVGEGQVKVYYSEDFTAEDVNYAIDYLEAKLYAMLGLEMPVKEEPVAEAPAAEAAAPAAEAPKAEVAPAPAKEAVPAKEAAPAKAAEPAAAPAPAKAKGASKQRIVASVQGSAGKNYRYLLDGAAGIGVENVANTPIDLKVNVGALMVNKPGWKKFFNGDDIDLALNWYVEGLVGTHFDVDKYTISLAAGARYIFSTVDGMLDNNKDTDFGLTLQAGVRYNLTKNLGIGLNLNYTRLFDSEDNMFTAGLIGTYKF